jgi:hypothetical protein
LFKIEHDYDIVVDLQPYTRSELKRNYIFHNEVFKKVYFMPHRKLVLINIVLEKAITALGTAKDNIELYK